MEHSAVGKVFNKISHDLYVDKIGSRLDDNIARWVVFKQNSPKNVDFPINADFINASSWGVEWCAVLDLVLFNRF